MRLFKHKLRLSSIFLLSIGEVLWGINIVANKVGVEHIPVFTFAATKFAMAAIILWPITRRHWKTPSVRDFVLLTASGWIGLGLNVVLYYIGLQMTTALIASVILAVSPMFVFFLSVKTLKEKFQPRILVGSVIALIGVLLIVFDPAAATLSTQSWFGGLLVLMSSLAAAVGTVTKKPLLTKYHTYQIVFLTMVTSTVPLGLLAIPEIGTININAIPNEALLAVGYGSFGALVIGFVAYFNGLSQLSLERASVFDYLLPVTGVVASIILLGEKPDDLFILGSSIVLLGLVISQLKIPHLLYLHHRHHH